MRCALELMQNLAGIVNGKITSFYHFGGSPLIPNSIPPRSADRVFTVATSGIAGLEFSRLRQAPEDARWHREQSEGRDEIRRQ